SEHAAPVARAEQCRALARGLRRSDGRREPEADRGEADRVDVVARVAHLDERPGAHQKAPGVADVDAILREGLVERLQRLEQVDGTGARLAREASLLAAHGGELLEQVVAARARTRDLR